MDFELHFVNRLTHGDKAAAVALAETLLARSGPRRIVRVVETFAPAQGADVADLALSERDLPEILSALHRATQVHIHDLAPALALRLIPYVKPSALEQTPLFIHGPWSPLAGELLEDATRFQAWPGPVRYDAAACECLGLERGDAEASSFVDRSDPALLPRPQGAAVLPGQAGRRLACVTLDAELSEDLRRELATRLQALSTDGLEVVTFDEAGARATERATVRRHSQAAIGRRGGQAETEAACQGIPWFALDGADRDAGATREDAVASVIGGLNALREQWLKTPVAALPI